MKGRRLILLNCSRINDRIAAWMSKAHLSIHCKASGRDKKGGFSLFSVGGLRIINSKGQDARSLLSQTRRQLID